MKHIQYIILATLLVLFANATKAQQKKTALFKTLKTKDSLLFEIGFNTCDLNQFESLLYDDFEFYHDKSGVTTSKAQFLEGMQNGICKQNKTTKSRRELVEGSLEVFPLKNNGIIYAALQTGIHKFYETNNGKESEGSIAKFSHLWVLDKGQWYLKRVISYDHTNPNQVLNEKIEISQDILNSYVGSYKTSQSQLVTISKTENELHIIAGKMDADIYPKSETVFFHENAPLTFEFTVSDNGKIHKMIVKENGKVVDEAIKQ